MQEDDQLVLLAVLVATKVVGKRLHVRTLSCAGAAVQRFVQAGAAEQLRKSSASFESNALSMSCVVEERYNGATIF